MVEPGGAPPFDFRANPIAPARTVILIHEVPEKRGTWAGQHGVHGYYLGPALTHYWSHHVFATATCAPRITDTVRGSLSLLSHRLHQIQRKCSSQL